MMDQGVMRSLRFLAVYASVSVFAVALLLFDTWPKPPSSAIEWLLLFGMVLPVILVGEWLSQGVLKDALLTMLEDGSQPFQTRWWRVFYYAVMCLLFATTTVAIFEWTRRL
jgi:hypothetical protein